jgi:hypothetical protein
MSDHLHEPDEHGDVVDQTEADLTEGPTGVRPGGAPPVDGEGPTPGHPTSATPLGTAGEVSSRGGASPAGPESSTTGTGGGTGADPDRENVPPTSSS